MTRARSPAMFPSVSRGGKLLGRWHIIALTSGVDYARTMTKTVHLLRHAQSAFNEVYAEGDPDPMLFDAPLSALGHEQVPNTTSL